MFIVVVQIPVNGSYNSALFKYTPSIYPPPPVTNTLPSCNTEAVCEARAYFILCVVVQVSVNGSYNSALFTEDSSLVPPHTNTFPFTNTVDVCPSRA